MRTGVLALLPITLAAGTAMAQEYSTPAAPPTGPTPVLCGDKTARFVTDKKAQLWVMRRGTIKEDDPLRPLSADPLVVLEVIVGNRTATALGDDYDSLHRGAAPAAIEDRHGSKIAWAAEGSGLPSTFRIESEDGAVATAFQFAECGEAPKIAAPKPVATGRNRARQPAASRAGAPSEPAAPKGFSIPQGAVR